MARLMIVDNERTTRELASRLAQSLGHEPIAFATGNSALDSFAETQPDLLLLELSLDDVDGLDFIKTCKAKQPDLPVITIAGGGEMDSAIEAMRLGAYDYLTKPFELEDLVSTIQAALAEALATSTPAIDPPKPPVIGPLVGNSEAVRKIQLLIDRIAQRPVNVVFEGEYGVGKIAFARQLHMAGPSRQHPFRTLHCSALPVNLLEQEFSAGEGIRGVFERTMGGTLVLEEVDTLPPRVQAILCDQLAIEDNPTRPFRVIGTTTRSIDELVRKSLFRADLFYRLAIIPVLVPALRNRLEDILPLAEHFLANIQAKVPGGPDTIDREARKLLQKYPWPGNVGELNNAIQRASALSASSEITPAALPARLRRPAPPLRKAEGEPESTEALPVGTSLNKFVREQERHFIRATLESVDKNKEKAAGILQVSLATLYRKMDD